MSEPLKNVTLSVLMVDLEEDIESGMMYYREIRGNLESALTILEAEGRDETSLCYEKMAWRVADALSLIAAKCQKGTQGIDQYTGRGVRIQFKDLHK